MGSPQVQPWRCEFSLRVLPSQGLPALNGRSAQGPVLRGAWPSLSGPEWGCPSRAQLSPQAQTCPPVQLAPVSCRHKHAGTAAAAWLEALPGGTGGARLAARSCLGKSCPTPSALSRRPQACRASLPRRAHRSRAPGREDLLPLSEGLGTWAWALGTRGTLPIPVTPPGDSGFPEPHELPQLRVCLWIMNPGSHFPGVPLETGATSTARN